MNVMKLRSAVEDVEGFVGILICFPSACWAVETLRSHYVLDFWVSALPGVAAFVVVDTALTFVGQRGLKAFFRRTSASRNRNVEPETPN